MLQKTLYICIIVRVSIAMCIKCGYQNININTKNAQETALKVQLAQALTVLTYTKSV